MRFSDINIQNIGKTIKGKYQQIKENNANQRAEAKAVRDLYNEQYAIARKKALAEELSKQAQIQAKLQAKAIAQRMSQPRQSGLKHFFSPQAVSPKINNQLNQSMRALMGGSNPVMNAMVGNPPKAKTPHRKKVDSLKSQIQKGNPNKELNDLIWKL